MGAFGPPPFPAPIRLNLRFSRPASGKLLSGSAPPSSD
uniref:Uncharacterized protein n=1 Tax=Anguilla anguilla TaxID=7936 RepID=A0A0E9VN31_ANGAN